MDFGIASVAGITVICYLAGMGMKASEKVKNEVIPVACGCAGAALGVAGMFIMPDFPAGRNQCGGHRYCVRPGGHGDQSGSKAAQEVGEEVIHSSPAASAGDPEHIQTV